MADEIDAILGTSEPAPAKTAVGGDDIDAILGTAPATPKKLDRRGREMDPRFVDEDEPKPLKNTGSFDEVMATFRGDKAAAKAAADAGITPQEGEGFFKRAFKSAAHGVHAIGTVGSDVVGTRGAALLEPAKRRQALRGIDDIVTLGYGQRFAARVGNALGDKMDTKPGELGDQPLGPETFGGKFAAAGAPRGDAAGLVEPGNIDLGNRPRVKNADGSISTVRSMGVNIDGQEVLIPTVSEDGRIMSDDEAVTQYKRTGRHLGKFRTPEESTAYAERLHEAQAGAIGRDDDGFLARVARGAMASGGDPVANTQAADQAVAAEYRTAGQFAGGFVPGAGQLMGKAGAAVVGKAIPRVTALLPATAAGVVKGVAGYEAAAPAAAALSANAEGNRLEAARAAATDPLGLLVAGGGGGLGEAFKQKTLESKGAKARELIEREGQGAEVTALSPGKGGVFDRELAGVPANDRGIGAAAKIGARGIADTIEQQFKDKHGFEYREGPAVLKESANSAKEAATIARRAAKAADIAYRDDISAAKDAVKTETATRAKQIIDTIEHEHRTETSKPYRALKNEIDNSPAAAVTRDVSPIVKSMQEAVNDLETAPFVRGALNEQLKILENYRTKQFNPDAIVEGGGLDGMKAGEAVALLEKSRKANPALGEEIDRIRAAATGEDGPIMVPERQLNGLRRTLMRSAKVGMSDAPGEAEAPLRRAAFVAKQMVDEGPYKALNDLYATGAAKREGARKAVGLPGKPSKSAAADEKRLTSNLRRLVDDETAAPGPLPPEADMAAVRAALKAPQARRDAAMRRVRADLAIAEKRRGDTVSKVTEATKGAEADRALLGLNSKIGTRKTDVNQIRLALQRQGENTGTAGGSAGASDVLGEFVAKHPEARPLTLLPDLQRAKADLSFHVTPGHGGIHGRGIGEAMPAAATAFGLMTHPIATLGGLAAVNRAPIAGRLLTPLARRTSAEGIGGRLGAVEGAGPSGEDIALAREIQAFVESGRPITEAIRMARASIAAQRAQAAEPAAPAEAP